MTRRDKKIISKWGRELHHDINIQLALADHERNKEFQQYCDTLVKLVPKVRIKKEGDSDVQTPTIRIDENINYQALPVENELEPFLSVFSGELANQISSSVGALLDQIKIPTPIKIFVAPACPHCPVSVRKLLALAKANVFVKLRGQQLITSRYDV